MKSRLGLAVAAMLCIVSASRANADVWQVDFSSSRLHGSFDIDGSTFVIPLSAAQPEPFNVVAADVFVTDPGALFGQLHYTAANVTDTSCTPAECRLSFSIQNFFVPGFGTYNLDIQFNFAPIWVPWVTSDQNNLRVLFHTDPFASSFAWNDVATGDRTVTAVPLHPLPPLGQMLLMGLGFGFLAYRRNGKALKFA
jgi:hypothetical protein